MRGERGYRGFVCGWTVGGAEWCWRVEGPSIHQGQGGASLGRNNRALTTFWEAVQHQHQHFKIRRKEELSRHYIEPRLSAIQRGI